MPGQEFQEWFISRAVPAMRTAIVKILAANPELAHEHAALQEELNWDEEEQGGKIFFAGMDFAPIHSMTDFVHWRATGETISRLDYARGHDQWIDFESCQFIPRCPKLPDCAQEPVEMILGVGKRKARKVQHAVPGTERLTWQQMCASVEAGLKPEDIAAMAPECWEKAINACIVFSGEAGTWVEVEARGQKREVECTGGGPVPKKLRG